MASQTKSVGAQRSAKAEAPALSTAAASCGSVSPSALKDKKTHALLKRVLALCKLFMVPDWRGHLRAKDKVTTNLTKALDGYSAECMANRKDDRLPILDRMREVVAGANELILNRKRQELPPLDFHEPVSSIVSFMSDFGGEGSDGGRSFAKDLLQLKVADACLC